MVGPALSPYAFGFFSFRVQFPEDYPSSAPNVVLLTTNGGRTRFNPNLYADGKVCLSTLGTWRGESGEQWSSVQNCHSILLSIQSLMDDNPYHNEPGFERETLAEKGLRRAAANGTQKTLEEITSKYNAKIAHETLRIAVCDVLEELFKVDVAEAHCFADTIKWHYLLYFDRYMEFVQANQDVTGQFDLTEFEYHRNAMSGSFDYASIETRLKTIKMKLEEESKEWVRKGEEVSAKGRLSYDCQHVDMAMQRFQRTEPDGISASKRDDNLFVWDVTFHGGLESTGWANGIYFLELRFPPEFPDRPPRPQFKSQNKMFHPQITPEGYPFLSESAVNCSNPLKVLEDVHNLLKNSPNPDPRTWVNKTAAELYFNEGDKGREEYNRTIRRIARRTMDDLE